MTAVGSPNDASSDDDAPVDDFHCGASHVATGLASLEDSEEEEEEVCARVRYAMVHSVFKQSSVLMRLEFLSSRAKTSKTEIRKNARFSCNQRIFTPKSLQVNFF